MTDENKTFEDFEKSCNRRIKSTGGAMKLTEKQQRFVEEYVVDYNATQAAIRAGYSANRAGEIGYQQLQKTPIQEALRERRKKVDDMSLIDAAHVRQKAEELRQMCMGEIPVKKTHMVDGLPMEAEITEFNPQGAKGALELLGKHTDVQAFLEKQEITGKDGGPVLLWGTDKSSE